MKFNLNKGIVTVVSESQEEALMLFALATRSEPKEKTVAKKEHKKHQFVKKCDICGKGFKGNRSLALHKHGAHNYTTPEIEKRRAYHKAWRARRAEQKPTEFSNIWK